MQLILSLSHSTAHDYRTILQDLFSAQMWFHLGNVFFTIATSRAYPGQWV